MSPLLQCYNKGCGGKFDPATNDSHSCTYHPGAPYFHDAYKIWSCCNKKSTDFSTWLSYPGCTKGPHNPEKPPEPEKPTKEDIPVDVTEAETPAATNGFKPPQAASRNEAEDSVVRPINRTVQQGLLDAIARQQSQKESEISENGASTDQVEIARGTSCQNNGCGASYEGPGSDSTECQHHSGMPIFHEGLKFWSCCQRKKMTDFDQFLGLEGCTFGKHCWTKKEDSLKTQRCREDWFSRGSNIVITIYSKGTLPDKTEISASTLSLKGSIVYNFGQTVFPLDYNLWGEVDPEASTVTITERKVEICLRKKEPINWPRLQFDPVRDAPQE
uniref:Cysteine and histidine-rich domain-containing protein 1 n=1 Tax=Plectus sambesii TaxID=2011161 RepID=A0A914V1Z8_9BILA